MTLNTPEPYEPEHCGLCHAKTDNKTMLAGEDLLRVTLCDVCIDRVQSAYGDGDD